MVLASKIHDKHAHRGKPEGISEAAAQPSAKANLYSPGPGPRSYFGAVAGFPHVPGSLLAEFGVRMRSKK